MFETLAKFQWEKCPNRFGQVEEEVLGLTSDQRTRDAIFRILWEHHGRCDCTVGRNIVDLPAVWMEVEQEINRVLERS